MKQRPQIFLGPCLKLECVRSSESHNILPLVAFIEIKNLLIEAYNVRCRKANDAVRSGAANADKVESYRTADLFFPFVNIFIPSLILLASDAVQSE